MSSLTFSGASDGPSRQGLLLSLKHGIGVSFDIRLRKVTDKKE
jgi:hypothetical protein